MSETVDKFFDHLIPKTGGVAIFVHKKLEDVTKKHVVKHIFCDGQELTVRNAKVLGHRYRKMRFECESFPRILRIALAKTIADDYE